MADHYETLGVPRDADPAAIKRSYRARVHRAHPDKGGKAEEFHAIQRAWDVLGDEKKRARYDRGEDPKAGHEDSLEERARKKIADLVLVAIASCPDLDHSDLIGDVTNAMRKSIEAKKGEIAEAEGRIRRHENARRRLRRKDGRPNEIAAMISSNMAGIRRGIEEKRVEIELCQLVANLLGEYEYRADAMPAGMRMGATFLAEIPGIDPRRFPFRP